MVFFKAIINDSTIYVKIDSTLIGKIHDVFHDAGYIISKATVDEWDYNIEYGTSFEMLTIEELIEFEEHNLKVKESRNVKK